MSNVWSKWTNSTTKTKKKQKFIFTKDEEMRVNDKHESRSFIFSFIQYIYIYFLIIRSKYVTLICVFSGASGKRKIISYASH